MLLGLFPKTAKSSDQSHPDRSELLLFYRLLVLFQPPQGKIAVRRAAREEDAVVKLDLGVVLAVGVTLLGVARRNKHADGGHLVADEGEVLAAAAVMGSMHASGMEPWPPLPWTTM